MHRSGKIEYLNRVSISNYLINHVDIVLSYQWGNEMNYLPLEVLYLGIPLVHNSPDFKVFNLFIIRWLKVLLCYGCIYLNYFYLFRSYVCYYCYCMNNVVSYLSERYIFCSLASVSSSLDNNEYFRLTLTF